MYYSVCVDANVDIHVLDVPVNAVATALKQFLIDLSESLVPSCLQEELIEAAGKSTTRLRVSPFFDHPYY